MVSSGVSRAAQSAGAVGNAALTAASALVGADCCAAAGAMPSARANSEAMMRMAGLNA